MSSWTYTVGDGDTPPTPDPQLPPSPEDEDSALWLLLQLFKIL